ncbi:hypothetical protein PsorP6_015782 [Peronosclerospora sorghi]|uniref:Uncharacterized protein n=1 Tax=Peronosclerospora sorghi TaxID=230839 RepID=A0ACC0WPC7_9STRA|nr:hypothetical protein PsorP6_015782 [Peronosclerospora sorghi]
MGHNMAAFTCSEHIEEKKNASGSDNDWSSCSSCSKDVASLSSLLSLSSEDSDQKTDETSNDWHTNLKPVILGPTFSESSSSNTLMPDAEMDQITSLKEIMLTEDRILSRDPRQYVFDIIRIIGSGSYGTVRLCRLRTCPTRLFAVKVIFKSKPHSKNGLVRDSSATREAKRLLAEKNVLCTVNHPFITKMYCSFQTSVALHFVLEYCPGGHMYFLLEKVANHRLPKDHVVFYAASIALALRYLHERGILYRDLKPENILLDEAGFVRLADFGLAREQIHRSDQSCTSFCGSADYMAPEVVRGNGYGLAADLWSFGCFVYEFLTGFAPFYSPDDRALLFRKICEAEPHCPSYFSPERCDRLSGLLHKETSQHLGNGPNGMQDICDHPFFANMSWHRLEAKHVTPPIIPKLASELDTSNFEDQFTSQHVEGNLVYDEQEQKHSDCGKEENQSDFQWL